ncbi:MAG: Gfo/Idh/MocA family oxidoreductase [Gammaproteobacteria bacterium]|nr:Gfo/Idh/MocA family oxidoreductase [Gammaproteobacteria bacterium]
MKQPRPTPGTPLRVAVVGVGCLGAVHADIYHRMPGVRLVAVVDTDRARAEAAAARHDCQAFDSAEQLVGRVDAASIVVPTSVHLPVAEIVLGNGIHAMLEKPVAPSVEESRAIVELAAARRVILQIGHLERFNAGVMKLAEWADNPRFIEVHRLGAFVERATDVDVVADLMIHDIDIVLSLVSAELKDVFAAGARVITEHIDIANARLEFSNGAVANVTASRVSRNRFRRIRVFSRHGYLGLNFTDQELDHVFTEPATGGARFPKLVERRLAVEPQLPLNAELAHFVDCVRLGRRPLVAGEDGLIAVQVAQQVRQKISESISQSTGG